jgi:hypothetical protein
MIDGSAQICLHAHAAALTQVLPGSTSSMCVDVQSHTCGLLASDNGDMPVALLAPLLSCHTALNCSPPRDDAALCAHCATQVAHEITHILARHHQRAERVETLSFCGTVACVVGVALFRSRQHADTTTREAAFAKEVQRATKTASTLSQLFPLLIGEPSHMCTLHSSTRSNSIVCTRSLHA